MLNIVPIFWNEVVHKKVELLALFPSFLPFLFPVCHLFMSWVHVVQGNNSSVSHFHFGMCCCFALFCFWVLSKVQWKYLLSLSPICLPSQTDNHFLCVYAQTSSFFMHIQANTYLYPYPPHTTDHIHTSAPLLLKISRVRCSHLSTQKSIFMGSFL